MPRRDPSTSDGALESLRMMWAIRRFEEAVEELFNRGQLHGTMHLSIGQEAVAEGVAAALEDGDMITSTHRGHGHTLAHGADAETMLAELLARDTGYCRGRGGSMHIADVAGGNLGANGIVAGSMTIAAGAALAEKIRGGDRVTVCFFGDGAANEGSFHEAINLAAIWALGVVFICENNQYGMSMASSKGTAGESVANRADAYGIPGVQVDGNDVVAVFEATVDAARRAREGEGPTLVEALTYRYRGHSKSDRNLYRTQSEIDDWRNKRDPVNRFEASLLESGVGAETIDNIHSEVREFIRQAVSGAFSAPPATVADLEGAAYAS